MSDLEFHAPSVKKMAGLLPSFEFEAQVSATDYDAVYMATQTSLDRHVAVKVYSVEITKNPAFKIAFDRAAQNMAKLSHLNLIAMFNSGEVEGMAYMVMEFVKGRSLISHLKKGKLPSKQATEVATGLASGVSYAHSHDVLHGGLSIDNILLNEKMEPKIGSFGFMIDTGEDDYERFSAPELSEPQSIITPQVDIYSLGVILYELLSGAEFSKSAKPLSSFAGVNPKLDAIFKKATATNPDERYSTAKEFRDAILKAAPGATGNASKLMATGKKGGGPKRQAANRPIGAGGAGATTPPPSVSGGGMKLVRNIAIIVVLLIAIKIAWNQKKAREQALDVDTSKEEVIKAELRNKKVEERQKEQERMAQLAADRIKQQNDRPEGIVEPEPKPIEIPEDKFGSLDRLQDKLLAGSRLDMPDGAERMGANDYLFVDKPLTWTEASQFAESYGGHLAVPNIDAPPQRLSKALLEGVQSNVWLGAARNSNSRWAFLTGEPWEPGSSLAGAGGYLAMNSSGSLSALEDEVKLPFIIQWHRDGKNPGALKNLLSNTKRTLNSLEPVYPPGTRAYGARHYLYVPRPVSWDEAAKIAAMGGGHLAIPSGVAERFNLKKLMRSLPAQDGVWYGGAFDGSKWVWSTGEAWSRANWSAGSDTAKNGTALVVMSDSSWVPKDRDETTSGFLIEWSNDSK